MRSKLLVLLLLCACVAPGTAFAQQTGVIAGKVVGTDNLVIPGVTVEARSAVMPSARVAATSGTGEYRLIALPPGDYTVTYVLSGMATVTKEVKVQLNLESFVNVTMSVGGVSETVDVKAEIVPAIERDSASIKSGVSMETIQSLPVGQEYRDLLKLIPGVQVTQDATRGPSAGGSGQDNVYKMDGVNVTLPLFGTLSAEPAAYDIAEVTTMKGGAKAVDFERTAGFSVDSVSKSGTSRYSGQFSYQFQTQDMAAGVVNASLSKYNQGLNWLTVNGGGPIVKDKAFFYASYYRPDRNRANVSNAYGTLPNYDSYRNEGFGKVTLTPASNLLLNASYRQSKTIQTGSSFCSTCGPTTGAGYESSQKVITADGSWVMNSRNFLSFKLTHFGNPNQGHPDYAATGTVNTAIGTTIDVNSLDKIGQLSVPAPITGQDAYNAFVAPVITKYGYNSNGVQTGSGTVGPSTLYDNDNFYRTAWQVAYNVTLGSDTTHELHFGYQRYTDSEDLLRYSNGWGAITVPGGRSASLGIGGVPAYYIAAFQQQTIGAVPTIHSSYWSQNAEINDTIRHKNVTVNLGVLVSNDRLYGQGLASDPTKVSGFVASAGSVYQEYEIPFYKEIQPRLGVTWAYNGQDTVYSSYSVYNPAASSLPRAASWARNLATTINAYFDQNGVLYGVAPVASSSGKMFVADLTPRRTQEFLVGTSKQINPQLTMRLYGRYRYSNHFWEDTNNTARTAFDMPAGWAPSLAYVGNLTDMLTQIGSGSSYVITELDRSYTKYYEVTLETEYRTKRLNVRANYTWSHYHGNFDQDNSTAGTGNDANVFIGSSNIGDGAGRQMWNNKDGTLHGDRPHAVKVYGYYDLGWHNTIGAFFLGQSGMPWEPTSYEPWINYTTSTSDTARYAVGAGINRSAAWYQLDLNYVQSVPLKSHVKVQFVADVYNVTNTQTGYYYVQSVHSALFGTPAAYLSPRRFQLTARVQF